MQTCKVLDLSGKHLIIQYPAGKEPGILFFKTSLPMIVLWTAMYTVLHTVTDTRTVQSQNMYM